MPAAVRQPSTPASAPSNPRRGELLTCIADHLQSAHVQIAGLALMFFLGYLSSNGNFVIEVLREFYRLALEAPCLAVVPGDHVFVLLLRVLSQTAGDGHV